MDRVSRYWQLVSIAVVFVVSVLLIAQFGARVTSYTSRGLFGFVVGIASIVALAVAVVDFATDRTIPTEPSSTYEKQGFQRLADVLSADVRMDRDPIEYWRTGFDFPAIRENVPVERRIDETEISSDLVSRLIDVRSTEKAGIVVTGPPGSGKSTVCKQVAERWYRQRGAVLYRDSHGDERDFSRVEPIRDAIDSIDEELLVVVEDAPDADANLVFELITEYQHDPSVTFVLDARQSSWDRIGYQLTEPSEISAYETITPYPLPSPTLQEYQRIVTHFEETVGPVSVTGEQLRDEFATSSGVGEMYLVGNTLVTVASEPNIDSERRSVPLTFEAEIQRTLNRLHGGENRWLAERVAVMANVVNLARLPLSNDVFHAFAENEEQHTEIDQLLSEIEGELIFRTRSTRYGNHSLWSVRYLELLLEMEQTARVVRLFEDCVNAVFRLHDDPSLRERIETYLVDDANTRYVRRIRDGDADGDDVVERLFGIGLRHRTLGELFRTTDTSGIQLPTSCTPRTRLSSTRWRAQIFEDSGRYRDAEAEYERLLDSVADRSLPAESDRWWRIRVLQRLAFLDVRQGDLESAERHAHRALRASLTTSDRQQIGASEHMVGYVLVERGQFDRAEGYLDAAIDRFRSLDRPTYRARSLGVRGLSAWKRGSVRSERRDFADAERYFSDAEAYHQASLELYEESYNMLGTARQLNNLGLLEWERGKLLQHCPAPDPLVDQRFESAKMRFNRAVELNERYGNTQDLARNYCNLGLIHRDRGDLETALEFHRRSKEIEEEVGNVRNTGISIHNIAIIHRRKGDLEKAHELAADAANTLVGIEAWYDAYRAIKFAMECSEELDDDVAASEWRHLGLRVADAATSPDWRSTFET